MSNPTQTERPDLASLLERVFPDAMAYVAAMVSLSDHGLPSDIQELLVYGNATMGVRPNALYAALAAYTAASPAPAESGEPVAWVLPDRLDEPFQFRAYRLRSVAEAQSGGVKAIPLFAHPPAESADHIADAGKMVEGSSGSPTSGVGVREAVIEECARAADAVAKEIKAKGWPQYAAQQCATAIRALSAAPTQDGGNG